MEKTSDILQEIASKRKHRLFQDGATQGLVLPVKRDVPLVDFISLRGEKDETNKQHSSGILIAEVKRKSPSKGNIAEIPKASEQAELYVNAGFHRVSVLTEEDYFGGSLADLISVKKLHPHLAVLRKDFLLSKEDVLVSYLAGSDAILLIATLLDTETLHSMYHQAVSLGLTCLVEVHTFSDVRKVKSLKPPLVGINSRNLRKFRIEPLLPLELRQYIDWPCDIIYESGISGEKDALFVRGSGFSGFLVGESVARNPSLGSALIQSWAQHEEAQRRYAVWSKLYSRYKPNVPFVKICGITTLEDAQNAVEAGADMIGFIMGSSPRQVQASLIRECGTLPVLKVAIMVLNPHQKPSEDIISLLQEGFLDFIQFHGDELANTVSYWPSYKAISLREPQDALRIDSAGSPAVLVDAFSPHIRGGSGKQLRDELIQAASKRRRLWLAGGLTPENIASVVEKFQPALVDVSTGVTSDVFGTRRKDAKKMHQFVMAAKREGQGVYVHE